MDVVFAEYVEEVIKVVLGKLFFQFRWSYLLNVCHDACILFGIHQEFFI